jgi:uncharacterized membrane protein
MSAQIHRGTPEARPAWLRPTAGEQRLWAIFAMVAAVAVQLMLPDRYVMHPRYVVPGLEVVLIGLLLSTNPGRISRHNSRVRMGSQAAIGLIAIANTVSAVLLVREIINTAHLAAVALLASGGGIWLTNVIVFALWYWEYDRGGPAARASGEDEIPDFLFPQMTDESLAADWEPLYLDYFYVSFTNATAFSPTDTLPLSRWAKCLMMAQSAVSLVTVALVAARAVNILPGS